LRALPDRNSVNMRLVLARLHWWTGLLVMPVLFVVALSGAVLAVAPWLESAFMPGAPAGAVLGPSELLARAVRQLPADQAVASIDWTSGRAPLLALRSGERWFVDPTTGRLIRHLAGQTPVESMIGVVHQVHVRLFAGAVGEWLVTIVSLVALFMTLSGVILWWRSKRLAIGRQAHGRRWFRDLHDALGVYSSLVIAGLALSGTLLAWEEPLYWAIGSQPEREPPLPHSRPPSPGEIARLGPDEWMATAKRALPGVPVFRLSLPSGDRSPVMVSFQGSGRPAVSTVWVDRWSAQVLRVDDFRTAPAAYRAHVYTRALHTGDLAGAPTVLVALLGSLALAALAFTAFVSWRMRPTRRD